MHQNALFLQRLCAELDKQLSGDVLFDCFSINKEEIFFAFGRTSMKASFLNGSMFLEFPDPDHLPQKNRQAQFRDLFNREVKTVKTHSLNRSFFIELDNFRLVFKCYGRNSNIILFKDKKAIELYRQNLAADLELNIDEFEREQKSLTELYYDAVEELAHHHRFISHDFQNFLKTRNGALNEALADLQKVIDESDIKLCIKANGKYSLEYADLEIDTDALETYSSAVEAVHDYSRKHVQKERFEQTQKSILTGLSRELRKKKKKKERLESDLQSLETRTPYYQIADVIMANLHQIEHGTSSAKLLNFYNNETITIPLKKDLSPQKNAEKYYKKGKNSNKEVHQIKSLLANIVDDIEQLEEQHKEVLNTEHLSDLKKWVKKKNTESVEGKEPFRVFEYKGYTIWVGKSSSNNDLLLKKAHKDDIWLHARNVAGSHTIIRKHNPEGLPKVVLEHAASLAAYYSKSRNDSLAEVIYTARKYVRKFKGAAAGQVKVEKESVILVEPLRR